MRIWRWGAIFIIYGSNLAIIVDIWLLLRHCPSDVRQLIGAMFMFCAPAQMIASPENVLHTRIGALAVSASLVLTFLMSGSQTDQIFALFALMGGLGMCLLAGIFPQTVDELVNQRLAADETARKLEAAHAAVTAERDAKTRFMAAASHDLGQPLQAASLFFDQVVRARDEATRSRASQGVMRAFAAAEQLLSHMLNHLRLDADRVEPIAARVALGPLLQKVTDQFAPIAREAGMRIRLVDSGDVLLTDPALLERSIGNLVSNAIQHSGGKRVLVGVLRRGGRVRIWVIDDGSGIGRADAAHIFDDYYQGAESKGSAQRGFGLGLASVRRIAQLMSGEAGLDRRWVRGAAFFLDLPDSGLKRRRMGFGARIHERRKFVS